MKYPPVAERSGFLIEHQRLKMARSAHAYMRGNIIKFYEWLEASNGHSIPDGPPIWICGDCHVGGVAHARQMSPADRQAWKKTLSDRHSVNLDAPPWLWTSIVDLVGAHEKAYLDHCRRFALDPERASA